MRKSNDEVGNETRPFTKKKNETRPYRLQFFKLQFLQYVHKV